MPKIPAKIKNDKRLTISKITDILHVSTHKIRDWERAGQFEAKRDAKGHRYFTSQDITKLRQLQDKENTRKYVLTKKVKNKYNNLKTQARGYKNVARVTGGAMFFVLIAFLALNMPSNSKDTIKPDVLGQLDRETNYQFNVNVPANLSKGVSVTGNTVFNDDISTPSINLTGLGTLAGLTSIDTTTETTLETTLDLAGDLEGTLSDVTVTLGAIEGNMLADDFEYEGDFDFKGEVKADGDGGNDGQILSTTGSGVEWIDVENNADTLDNLDSTKFLRSDTDDAYTSGTLSFSDGTFLDLSSIQHNDTAVQGLKLPQATTLTSPTTGEGYLAYDTDADTVYMYNGSTWANIATLQQAYVGGGDIQLSAGEGDIRIYNDNSNEMFFLDESTGRVGIGTTSPTSTLHVVGSTILGGASSDSITFTARVANGTSLLPDTNMGSDLGSATNRFNNLWVANINSNSSQSFAGQTTFTYAPQDTTIDEASVLINPTTSAANGQLLGFAIAGYQKALVDEDGDITLGYNDQTSAPATDNPLQVYGHNATNVAYINTSGNAYFAGNIGIGTTDPQAKLEISDGTDNIQLSPTRIEASDDLFITAGGTDIVYIRSNQGMRFFDNIPTTYGTGQDYAIGYNSANDTLQFVDGRTIGTNVRMVLDSLGNLGIGTTNPQSVLHLGNTDYGDVSDGLTFGDGDLGFYESSDDVLVLDGPEGKHFATFKGWGGEGIWAGTWNSRSWVLKSENMDENEPVYTFYNDTDTGIAHEAANSISFLTDGTEDMRLVSGSLGIGTTDPTVALDVAAGNIRTGSVANKGSLYFGGTTRYVRHNSGWWYFTGSESTEELVIDLNASSSSSLDFNDGNLNINANEAGAKMALQTQDTDRMTILSTGNVGIGTTSPSTELDVNGKISINGTQTIYNADALGFSGTLYIGNGGTNLNNLGGSEGYYNTALGFDALPANTTGNNNTALGRYALKQNSTGTGNVGVGGSALQANTTGIYNTAVGVAALQSNTANYNTALGYLALWSTSTGGNNTAVGQGAMRGNTTGASNTALGMNAGYFISGGSVQNTTSDYSLYLGMNTKALADNGQNEIVIGYDTTGIGSNTVTLGNNSITTTALKGSVGIGTTNPEAKLEVSGGDILLDNNEYIQWKDTGGTARGLLRLDDADRAWFGGTTVVDAMFIDVASGKDINFRDGAGSNLTVDGGANGIAVGTGYAGSVAPPSDGAIIKGNVGIGTTAPGANIHIRDTTDSASILAAIFEGDRATPTDGDDAYVSLKLSGDEGTQKEAARITWELTTVDETGSIEDGDLAFSSLVNDSLTEMLRLDGSAGQLALGSGISKIIQTGNVNSAIEFSNATINLWTVNQASSLGLAMTNNNATLKTNNLITLDVGNSDFIKLQDNIGQPYIQLNSEAHDADLRISGDTETNLFYVDASTDKIGIGTTGPGTRLEIYEANAALRLNDDGTDYVDLQVETDGDFTIRPNSPTQASNYAEYDGDSNWDFYSDERLKTNINDAENLLDKVLELQIRRFNYKEGDNRDFQEIGLIAQEVEPYFPELVSTGNHPLVGSDAKTLGYTTFGVLAIKAIQEQQLLIDELTTKVSALDSEFLEVQTEDTTNRIETLQEEIALINKLLGMEDTTETSESSPLSGLEGLVLEITDVYNGFKEFVEALGLSKITDEDGNDVLAVSSDMTVTGSTTLADVTITGDVMAGLIKIDTVDNEISVIGPECEDNKDLCETQTLYLQKSLAGNIDLLDGVVIIEPNGNVFVEKTLEAEKIVAGAFSISKETEDKTVGTATIEEGEKSIQITTEALTEDSVILVTPRDNPIPLSTSRKDDNTFKITLAESQDEDIEVDWLIINIE